MNVCIYVEGRDLFLYYGLYVHAIKTAQQSNALAHHALRSSFSSRL